MDYDFRKMFFEKQVPYEVLNDTISKEIPKISKTNNINILLDMDSIFNTIWKPYTIGFFEDGLKHTESYTLSLAILNLIGHYRNYFAKSFRKYTTFYLYRSTSKSQYHLKVDKNYKKTFYAHRYDEDAYHEVRDYVDENYKIVEKVVGMLPNIFYLDIDHMDDTVFPYKFLTSYGKLNGGDATIIMSNRHTAFINQHLLTNCYVMSLRSLKTKLSSNVDNIRLMMTNSSPTSMPKFLKDNKLPFLIDYIIPVLSLSGYSNFDIKNIEGKKITKVLKAVKKAIDDGDLPEYREPINKTMKKMGVAGIFNVSEVGLVMKNIRLLTVNKIANLYSNEFMERIYDQIDYTKDLDTLNYINSKYYQNYLRIDFLYEGEKK